MSNDHKPAPGDGITFGLSAAEMRECGKYIADRFFAEQNLSLKPHARRPAFFRTIGPDDIHDWIAMRASEKASAMREQAA